MNEHLLSDAEVARFLVSGYHLVEPELPAGLNESIATQLDVLDYEPRRRHHRSCARTLASARPPDRQRRARQPARPGLRGAVASPLALQAAELPAHELAPRWPQQPRRAAQPLPRAILPRPTSRPDMGPTIIVPGTQFRNAADGPHGHVHQHPRPSAARGQGPGLWPSPTTTSGTARRPTARRTSAHMIKFLFRRTQDNTEPTWNHDPEAANKPADWNERDRGRGRHQHPQLHQSVGRLPERPLQGARHPPPELELSHGPVGLISTSRKESIL